MRTLAPPTLGAEPRRTSQTTAGKAPLRLSNDPVYLGHKVISSEESHLTMTEALKSLQAGKWEAAKERELKQLEEYGVYE